MATVGGDFPVRIVDRVGRQHAGLSRALSALVSANAAEGRRDASLIVWVLNVVEPSTPQAAEAFTAGVAACRGVVDRFVKVLGIASKAARERDGSRWLSPPPGLYRKIGETLVAIGRVTALLRDEAFGGTDPSKVDPALSRLDGRRTRYAHGRDGRHRLDTDRRLRLRANPDAAPRYADPCFHDRLAEGVRLNGSPEAFERMIGLAYSAGPRACQVLAINLHDVLVGDGPSGRIAAISKGRGAARRLRLVPGPAEFDRLMRWIDGPRAKLSGMSLSTLSAMARNPSTARRLKDMPLFTEDGVSPIRYQRLYAVVRAAAERMDLYIDEERYRDSGVKRFVSFHWLRHEYVHRRLDRIEAGPAVERERARRSLVEYMGWAPGIYMLDWYSAHHRRKHALGEAVRFGERADLESVVRETASAPAVPELRRTGVAELLVGFR